jgi:hypothetical protein
MAQDGAPPVLPPPQPPAVAQDQPGRRRGDGEA